MATQQQQHESEDRRLHNMPKSLARSCVSQFIAWGHDHKGDPAGYQAFLEEELPNHHGVDAEKVRLFFKNLAASYVERYLPACSRGYSEDFLTWWENRPGRGRPKKSMSTSSAYLVPAQTRDHGVPTFTLPKSRKKVIQRYSPEPAESTRASKGRGHKFKKSAAKKMKPRRVVVVNARSANKFEYTMMDMDDTKLAATPHGDVHDDVSINEDDVTIILHNLRTAGTPHTGSFSGSTLLTKALRSPRARSPLPPRSPLSPRSPRSPRGCSSPSAAFRAAVAAAALASPRRSPSPSSAFHYLAQAASSASGHHHSQHSHSLRRSPTSPSMRSTISALSATSGLNSPSLFAPLHLGSRGAQPQSHTPFVRPIPQRPYTTPSMPSAPRVFFPSAREPHPDVQASHDLAARLLSLQQRQRVQQLQSHGQSYSLHHQQAMNNAYRLQPLPPLPSHATGHADSGAHTRDMYHHYQQQQQQQQHYHQQQEQQQQQQQQQCRFEGRYMN